MSAVVTVLVTAAGLVVLGACEIREALDRRAGRRRLRALREDADAWAMHERIRGLVAG